jgi:ubiquinone/menaquinone biosynthesis C-methylase UbiE
VFAVDISESSIQALQRNASNEKLDNIELVLGEPDDPRLPYGSLDGIVIVNAYHEMVQRVAMLDAFKRALKPAGVIVIVDNIPLDSLSTRSRQTNSHQLALSFAEDDLVAQGFEIVRREPQFISQGEGEHPHRQWLLVARKIKK